MRNFSRILVLLVFGVFLVAGNAMALSFENNITIYDGRGDETGGIDGEDNETEPGMVNNQNWDLEAFFWDGSELTMVGGFNLDTGSYEYNNATYTAGDIFVDEGSDGKYDYVFDMNYAENTYVVFGIDGDTVLGTSSVDANTPWSDPFNYVSDGISTDYAGSIANGLYTEDVGGLTGGTHYAVGVDLSFLKDAAFTVHATLSCGNDNLMGKTAPVPEPATMLLFGCGLVGMATVGRKKFRK